MKLWGTALNQYMLTKHDNQHDCFSFHNYNYILVLNFKAKIGCYSQKESFQVK